MVSVAEIGMPFGVPPIGLPNGGNSNGSLFGFLILRIEFVFEVAINVLPTIWHKPVLRPTTVCGSGEESSHNSSDLFFIDTYLPTNFIGPNSR